MMNHVDSNGRGGRTMSLIHNRLNFVVLALAFAVVLLGAGCGKQEAPAGGAGAVSDNDGLPTKWAEYRSETLGISIPYPEGWWVEEREELDGAATEFYEAVPPPESDASPRLWIEQRTDSMDALIEKLDNIVSDERVVRSGLSMRRITRRDDRSDDEGLAAFYLWEQEGKAHRIGGRDGDRALEYLVDHIEVLP